MLIMQIFVVLGVGVVIYAVFGVFTAGKLEAPRKQKIQEPKFLAEDSGREQKIQHLQSQVAKLENQLEQIKVASIDEKPALMEIKAKEAEFLVELKRREEWVARAEAELARIKSINLDLSNKFIAKENELQEEFTKNVNFTRQIQEMKASLEERDKACRLKEDQLQAQKHQMESQLKSINEHLATIAEFNRKEKISEWVPKAEHQQLNQEYLKLEKDLASSQERLKNFAVEIAHLRQSAEKKIPPAEEVKSLEIVLEENKPVEPAREETSKPKETILEEVKPAEIKLEENKITEEGKAVDEDLEKKTKQTPD